MRAHNDCASKETSATDSAVHRTLQAAQLLHEALTLEDMAEAAGLGVCTFSRRFRETQGRAPHAFVIDQRVKRARELLTIGDLAVKEIAASCGFSDQAHMTRVLRARLGTTPAKLRAARG